MHDDPAAGLPLIGTQPDYGQLGGALTLFDPRTVAGQLFRDVAASGLSTHRALWHLVPVPGAAAVRHLAMFRRLIYGTTNTGTLFVVDPHSRRVLTTEQAATHDEMTLVARPGAVYSASHQQLVGIDPRTYAIRLAVPTLGAGPFAYRQLSNGGGCYVYTLTGDDAAPQRRARPTVTHIGTVSRGRVCGR